MGAIFLNDRVAELSGMKPEIKYPSLIDRPASDFLKVVDFSFILFASGILS